jgi:pilus assembly protein Flp/PilA
VGSSPDHEEEGSTISIDRLRTLAERSSREEDGQGLAEYALILALIAIVAILSMIFLGDTIADLLDTIGSTIDASRP